MIVQSVPEGAASEPHFVIKLQEHLVLVGQFAEAYGNDEFELASEPREKFYFAARWHDKGWHKIDDNPPLDPGTNLPYNLVESPIQMLLDTGPRSIDFNEEHDPYCGLIDSMHIWGLYSGRYGMSEMVLIDNIPSEHKPAVQAMLDHEKARQERIKADLAASPDTVLWVEEKNLFRNYKMLQFFDTLALYFNCTHEAGRGENRFTHVPLDLERDTEVTIKPLGNGEYGLSPYPFRTDRMEVSFEGRYLEPFAGDTVPDMAQIMRTTPVERQTARLLAG
ncbi:MAG: DUF3891 family protein [Alphaproteobacteria bacterium]|nr:DUF3891 family protein [Alphaproteobacteria bacterium]